jgi:subtilisin family serine protease
MFTLKNLLKIGGLIVGIMICSSVFAQSSYYYYGGGTQRPLLLSPKKVTVKFVSSMNLEDIKNFILTERALDSSKEPEPTFDRFYVLYVILGNDVEQLIQRLRAREEVELANPVYLTSDYMEMLVTDRFVVQFYSWVSRLTIDSLNALHGAVIVDSLTLWVPNLFLLKLTGEIDKDVLTVANQYYEEPTTDYSHPDFIAEIQLGLYPENNYYYYSAGMQIPLNLSEEKVTIKFLPSFTFDDINTFILTEPALDPSIEPEPIFFEFYLLYVLPGNDIEALIQRLRARQEVTMANPVYLTEDTTELITTDRFVAQFSPLVPRSTIDSLNALHGVVIIDSLSPESPNLFVLRLTGGIDIDALVTANQYYEDLSTDYSHPDFAAEVVFNSHIPNDSFFQYQWNYENTGQIQGKIDADIDASLAWVICKGDSELKVAVLDMGIEAHEDLEPLAQGYDLCGADPRYPQEDWDPTPGNQPWCAHGEACAGLIAAIQDNSIGVSGLASLCQIVPIKIWPDEYLPGPFYELTSIHTKAFYMAASLGAKVASNSWGYTSCYLYYDDIAQAINYFVRPRPSNPEGGIVVFSSGNGYKGCVNFPANLDSVIAVGASDSVDGVWAYSNGGTALDLVAPSGNTGLINQLRGDIWTLDLMGERGFNPMMTDSLDVNGNQDYTARFGGTSAACPQVAATAALIKAQWWRLYPGSPLYSMQVKKIIENSAEDTVFVAEDTTWKGPRYGYGRLNTFRALLAISRGDVNNDKSISVSDQVYLIDYLFKFGAPPVPVVEMGDANCDGQVSLSDIVYLISYLFKGGAKPPLCYKYPNNY